MRNDGWWRCLLLMRSDIDEESLAIARHVIEPDIPRELEAEQRCRGKSMKFLLCFSHLGGD